MRGGGSGEKYPSDGKSIHWQLETRAKACGSAERACEVNISQFYWSNEMNKVLYSFHSERGKMGTKYYSTSFFFITLLLTFGMVVLSIGSFVLRPFWSGKCSSARERVADEGRGEGGKSDCARFTYQIIVSLFSSFKELLSLPCDIDISPNENQLAKLGHNSPFPWILPHRIYSHSIRGHSNARNCVSHTNKFLSKYY